MNNNIPYQNQNATANENQPSKFAGIYIALKLTTAGLLLNLPKSEAAKVIFKLICRALGETDSFGDLKPSSQRIHDDLLAFALFQDKKCARNQEKCKHAANVRWGNLGTENDAYAMHTQCIRNANQNQNQDQEQTIDRETVAQNEASSFAHNTEISNMEDIRKAAEKMGLAVACDDAFTTEFFSSVVMNGWLDGKHEEIENHMLYLKRALIKNLDDRTWGTIREYCSKLSEGGGQWPKGKTTTPTDFAKRFLELAPAYLRFCNGSEENKARVQSWIKDFQDIMNQTNARKRGRTFR